MPFEFVCPFCHTRTKVADEYLGQGGPCVNCGRHVVMPTRNAEGVLVPSLQSGQAPSKKSKSFDPKHQAMMAAVGVSVLVLFLTLTAGALWFVLPRLREGMAVSAQRRDLDNMRTIVTALNDYCARYGTYPTPNVTDAAGKKLYSWRVLILPFLGYEDLYSRFQRDQSWDSPANMALLREMPSDFASPNAPVALQNQETNYALLVGPGTVFPPSGPLSLQLVTDDPTLLLVETKEGGFVWTQPGDIDIGTFGLKVGTTPMQTIGGQHAKHVVAVDCNGQGLRIPKETPSLVLDALVTPMGGEKVDAELFLD